MKKIIIAIDGFSGCGKSTTARGVAKELNYIYLDSGAMYRAVTRFFLLHSVDLKDELQVAQALEEIQLSFEMTSQGYQIAMNGTIVEPDIRSMEVSRKVSDVASISAVRRQLVSQQQMLGKEKGVVMDGRDIGTVVFPDAELKVFMRASLDIRAERRLLELKERRIDSTLTQVLDNLKRRDRIDSSRADSPLMKAEDAVELDTSNFYH